MGKLYAELDKGLRAFIEAQHIFFVATAPLSAQGANLRFRALNPYIRDQAHEIGVGSWLTSSTAL